MKPAARVDDMHSCPVVVPKYHVGGLILAPAEATVQIGGKATARISDLADCVLAESHDVITEGAATVLVAGLCASRKTDATAHGGQIERGLETVLIGGADFKARKVEMFFEPERGEWCFRYGSAIVVAPDSTGVMAGQDPNFQSRALQSLVRLDSTPTMHAALDELERTGRTVTIEKYSGAGGPFNATTDPKKPEDAFPDGFTQTYKHLDPTVGTGHGSDSVIAWSPDVNTLGTPPGEGAEWQAPGADVILAHELLHGVNNATGAMGTGPFDGSNVAEERDVVGLPAQIYHDPHQPDLDGAQLPDTSARPFTENRVREDYRDRGIVSPVTWQPPVPRPSYSASGDPY